MKKIFAASVIFLKFTLAWGAGWSHLFSNHNGDSYFVDPTSKRGVEIKRVWTKVNFESPQSFGALSVRSLEEFDCKGQRARILQFTAFSGKNFEGVVLNSSSAATPWLELVPESSIQKMFRIICES